MNPAEHKTTSTPSEKREEPTFDHRDIDARNVSSSTAGASSGNFHVYLSQRRRETDRLANLRATADAARADAARRNAFDARIAKEDVRTARRAAKRRRAKQRRQQRSTKASVPSSTAPAPALVDQAEQAEESSQQKDTNLDTPVIEPTDEQIEKCDPSVITSSPKARHSQQQQQQQQHTATEGTGERALIRD